MMNQCALEQKVLACIRKFAMFSVGDKVLAAVSGGPDSLALLYVLLATLRETGIGLHIAHLNHSFRGAESDADAEYVRELAHTLGLPCTIEKMDVPDVQQAFHLSREEAARLMRYDFLEGTASDVGATRIALGHTADDQAETVLMNLLRGAGLDGLAGMPPVRGRLVRPLLEVRRSEVEAYLEDRGLQPRVDASNLDRTYTRNRIRHGLLPLLRSDYNPEVDSALLRLAELSREDAAYLNKEAATALERVSLSNDEVCLRLDVSGLMSYAPAMRRRVLRGAVLLIRSELADVGLQHIDAVLRLLEGGGSFEYDLPGGTFIRRSGNDLAVRLARPARERVEFSVGLAVPGEARVLEAGLVVSAEVVPGSLNPIGPPESLDAVLDYSSIVGKLSVRSWRPGDRIRPLGMIGEKKVQDVFVDAKVAPEDKWRTALVCDEEKILWIVGLMVSEAARVTASTAQCLVLRAKHESD